MPAPALLSFSKSNVFVNCSSADVADPCKFRHIQLLALGTTRECPASCSQAYPVVSRKPLELPLSKGRTVLQVDFFRQVGYTESDQNTDTNTEARNESGGIKTENGRNQLRL